MLPDMNRLSFRYAPVFAAAMLLAAPLLGLVDAECAHGCSCGLRLNAGPAHAAHRLAATPAPHPVERPALVSAHVLDLVPATSGAHVVTPLRPLRI
jgi:hypothetical protein